MAQKKITDLTLRTDFDETCNVPVDDAVQTWRVTGEQMKDFMKAEIAPLSAKGDLLVGDTDGAPDILAGNTTTTPAILTQTGDGTNSAKPSWRAFKSPTVQKFTSGSGTYTTPAGVKYIRVRMVGGGAGGSGGGSGAGAGTGGNDSTFGSSFLTATGGAPSASGTQKGGTGGAATVVGLDAISIPGGSGSGAEQEVGACGGHGGCSAFGGAGGAGTTGDGNGKAGATNSGSGGGGGAAGSGGSGGGGGGAGGFIDVIIPSPSATYGYVVGSSVSGGSAGTGGGAGGGGAAGLIMVEEFYQ